MDVSANTGLAPTRSGLYRDCARPSVPKLFSHSMQANGRLDSGGSCVPQPVRFFNCGIDSKNSRPQRLQERLPTDTSLQKTLQQSRCTEQGGMPHTSQSAARKSLQRQHRATSSAVISPVLQPSKVSLDVSRRSVCRHNELIDHAKLVLKMIQRRLQLALECCPPAPATPSGLDPSCRSRFLRCSQPPNTGRSAPNNGAPDVLLNQQRAPILLQHDCNCRRFQLGNLHEEIPHETLPMPMPPPHRLHPKSSMRPLGCRCMPRQQCRLQPALQ